MIEIMKHHLKNYSYCVQKTFDLLIFAGCLIFVVIQGSQCIMKFVDKPEAVTTSYDYAGKYPFPEITICSQPFNQNPLGAFPFPSDLYPKPYNETILKKCGLTWQEYQKNAQWVGNKSDPDCMDPYVLSQQVFIDIKDLGIEFIEIQTFESIGFPKKYYMNDTVESEMFFWKTIHYNHGEFFGWGQCYTLVIKDEIAKTGIYSILFQIKGTPNLIFLFHHKGIMNTQLPGVSWQVLKKEYHNAFPVEHEVINLLNYDGEKCNNSIDYDYHKCRGNYIHQVSNVQSFIFFFFYWLRGAFKGLYFNYVACLAHFYPFI